MNRVRFYLCLWSAWLVCAVSAADRPYVVAYVPNWIDLTQFCPTIDYSKITHINVAFENPTNAAGDLSYQKQNTLLLEQAHTRGIKVLVSLGGGAASENASVRSRYFSLLSQPKRAMWAAKLADYVKAHGFDGLDVDIEGPMINPDYGPFVQELARVLKPRGKLLTAALSKGYGSDRVTNSVLEAFDFVNVMAYNRTGTWAPKSPGQHSSLDFAKESVSYWVGRGLPRSKIVLGVPFYGYGFGGAYRSRDYPYREILGRFPGAEQLDQVGDTIWYNGISTVQGKARYAREEGLAGIMIWSLDYDGQGECSLLSAIHGALNPSTNSP